MSFKLGRWGGWEAQNSPSGKDTTRRTGLIAPGALGRPKPAVIGTGRVDGIPVYGLTKVVRTTYSYKNYADQYWDHNGEPLPEPTTAVTISAGYLLCKDYFRRGYKLIRLEANGDVQFDAENGSIPKCAFRFYNGLHTAVDPIATQVVGENAGAHTGDVLIFLEDFPASSAPTITCVISNAATDVGGIEEIEWTGEEPVNLNNTPRNAYDPIDGRIYQILGSNEIPSLTTMYLSVLDVDTSAELYRVPLEDTTDFVGSNAWIVPLRGTGYVVIRTGTTFDSRSLARVYSAVTGQIIAEWMEEPSEAIAWMMSQPFDDKWLLIGDKLGGGGETLLAVIDIALGSFSVTRIAGIGDVFFSLGRISAGSTSFFIQGGSTCTEVTYNGETWSTAIAYSSFGIVQGIQYDPLTEYLLVLEEIPSGTHNVQLVAPDTGAIADAFTISTRVFALTFGGSTGIRAFPKPGFGLFRSGSEDLWSIDINNHTATLLDDVQAETGNDARNGLYDQARSSYFAAYGNTVWTKYTLPGTQPGQISLDSHITDILTCLGPYDINELVFEGF